MIESSEPIFAVTDVIATVRYYRDVLGFESQWLWPDPPTFGGVRWGRTQILFSLNRELQATAQGHQHFFRVGDVNGLYERHRAAGAIIAEEIANKPWGLREYTVRDLNGYRLRFTGPPTYERPATATDALPAHIHIETRLATPREYEQLITGVGWINDAATADEALRRSLFGICAVDTRDGQTVGMVRACGDGRYFTLWDVIVLPAYQGQKIGSAIIEAALTELRRIGPRGSFVGLFTSKPKFYQRAGFVDDHGMHLAL